MTAHSNPDAVCIVVGASHAGSQLAVQVRKEGWEGRIILIGDETPLPYHRPPLSKAVLAGEKTVDAIALRPAAMYENNNIELMLGTRVDHLDRASKTVRLSSGESLSYDKLALCTGARLRTIEAGAELPNVFYLRQAHDLDAIRAAMPDAKRVVIIGAGYIGLEVAAVMAKQDDMTVTVLEMADRILQRVASPIVSQYFTDLHSANGVEIYPETRVTDIRREGQYNIVSTLGGKQYEADIVVIGVGVVAETQLAEDAGLQVSNGIVVDARACTEDEDIYAAGDCTWHPNALYGRYLRLECVQNALDQAKVAAANIVGKDSKYESLPWFWSDQFDVKLQSVGLSDGYDELIVRGDTSAASDGFTVFYFREGQLIASDSVNRAKEFMACKRIIAQKLEVNREALADIGAMPDQFAKA
ncbi:MAG: FAD/NAD(P)-binding oxidoreductase [Pseudohongiellaceae bacterium]|nr:FAD/NAD(P)-binding oxidoreductase [Pseudohongiellaceae bacterium]